ncbi:hypothetical protein AB9F29_20045 [Falsihalocynthiibacter sp. S25ZX9]|uniref:hypothetical protein n=1 Tax=Falsihalocynthiibacter sp. S25ZX9 TaxID=3240870 RepID=UPI00350F23D9
MSNNRLSLDQVRERLQKSLDKSGKSMRTTSIEAGAGAGYLHSLLKDKKEPGICRLAAICDVLDVSLTYVLHGYDVSPETEAIMNLLEGKPAKRESILNILTD